MLGRLATADSAASPWSHDIKVPECCAVNFRGRLSPEPSAAGGSLPIPSPPPCWNSDTSILKLSQGRTRSAEARRFQQTRLGSPREARSEQGSGQSAHPLHTLHCPPFHHRSQPHPAPLDRAAPCPLHGATQNSGPTKKNPSKHPCTEPALCSKEHSRPQPKQPQSLRSSSLTLRRRPLVHTRISGTPTPRKHVCDTVLTATEME